MVPGRFFRCPRDNRGFLVNRFANNHVNWLNTSDLWSAGVCGTLASFLWKWFISWSLDDVNQLSVLDVLDDRVEAEPIHWGFKKNTVFWSDLSSSSIRLAVWGGSEALVRKFCDWSIPLWPDASDIFEESIDTMMMELIKNEMSLEHDLLIVFDAKMKEN